jgi:hypothetical protein
LSLDEDILRARYVQDKPLEMSLLKRRGDNVPICTFCHHGYDGFDKCQVQMQQGFATAICLCDHVPPSFIERRAYESMQGIDKRVAATLRHRDVIYHVSERNRDGTPLRARINGMLKTWKKDPKRFKLPMKHGMYSHFYLSEDNAREWRTDMKWTNAYAEM